MLPADQDVCTAAVVLHKLLHTLGIISIARCINRKSKVVGQRLDSHQRTGAFPTYSTLGSGKIPPLLSRYPGGSGVLTRLWLLGDDVPNVVTRRSPKYVSETLSAIHSLSTESVSAVCWFLTMTDQVHCILRRNGSQKKWEDKVGDEHFELSR